MQTLDYRGLIVLRGADENTALARRALGPDATAAQIKALANYFSRIVRGGVPKVGIGMLELLAIGLDYDSLAAFFADWAHVSAGEPLPYRGYFSRTVEAGAKQPSDPRGIDPLSVGKCIQVGVRRGEARGIRGGQAHPRSLKKEAHAAAAPPRPFVYIDLAHDFAQLSAHLTRLAHRLRTVVPEGDPADHRGGRALEGSQSRRVAVGTKTRAR
jgi:hypothetical protein